MLVAKSYVKFINASILHFFQNSTESAGGTLRVQKRSAREKEVYVLILAQADTTEKRQKNARLDGSIIC